MKHVLPMPLTLQHSFENFHLDFSKPCFACGNPTIVILRVKDPLHVFMCLYFNMRPEDRFTQALVTWYSFRPLDLAYNIPIYRCFDGTARRVCTSCYLYRYKHINIYKAEITGRTVPPVIKSLSHKEIHEWFTQFRDFWQRIDCDSLFIDFGDRWTHEGRLTPGLLRLFLF